MAEIYPDLLNETENVLTVIEVADILHSNRNKIYQLLSEGSLPGFKLPGGRNWLVPQTSLNAYIRSLGKYSTHC